jgi:hypothetical protein
MLPAAAADLEHRALSQTAQTLLKVLADEALVAFGSDRIKARGVVCDPAELPVPHARLIGVDDEHAFLLARSAIRHDLGICSHIR